MWCWTRIGDINWTDRVKNEVLHRVEEDRNILHRMDRRKANGLVKSRVGSAF